MPRSLRCGHNLGNCHVGVPFFSKFPHTHGSQLVGGCKDSPKELSPEPDPERVGLVSYKIRNCEHPLFLSILSANYHMLFRISLNPEGLRNPRDEQVENSKKSRVETYQGRERRSRALGRKYKRSRFLEFETNLRVGSRVCVWRGWECVCVRDRKGILLFLNRLNQGSLQGG